MKKTIMKFLGLAALCGLGLNALATDTSVTDLDGLQSALNGAQSGNTVTVAGGAAIEIPAGTTLTVGDGVALNVLGTLTNNGAIEGAGTVNVQTMVYTVETRTPYEGVSYDVTATYNGAVSGTAPTCAVAYQVSVDGGANWIAGAENTCCVVAYEDAEGKHFSAYSDLVSGANSEAVRIWSTYSIVPTIYFVKDVNVHYTPSGSKYGGYNIGRSGVQNVIIDGAGHKITGTNSGTTSFVATIKVHNHSTAVFKNLEITRMISGKPYLDITANADNTITCTFFNVTLKKNGGGYGIQYNSDYANAAIWTTYYDVNNEVSFTFDGGNKNHVSVYSGRYSQKPLYSVIYGGRFGDDPTDYVAPGKAVLTDSDSYPYLVCDPSATEHVAEVWDAGKGKLYNDAALAMKSIKMGSLVKLLGVTCSQNASIPAGGAGTGLTVELIDGAQYTGNVTAAAGYKVEKSESDTVITYTVSVDPETADVRIGDVYYAAFDDAVKAAQDGDTLTLNKDVQFTKSGPRINSDIVIDLNGHQLLGSSRYSEQYQVSAELTVVDSVGGGAVSNKGGPFFAPYYGGVVNVRGGRFESDEDDDLFFWNYCYSGSEVNLYGGVFIGKLAAGKPLHIYGGTFSQDPTAFVPDDDWYVIDHDDGTGLWTVTKKPVQAKLNEVEYYVANDAVVAAMSGDTITFFGGTATAEKVLADGETLTLVNAEGHYDYAKLVQGAPACDLSYDTSVENTVTITSTYNEDNCQAMIVDDEGNVVYYPTFADAIGAAKSGATVSVLKNIALTEAETEGLVVDKSVTIDLAGLTIAASSKNAVVLTVKAGTCGVVDFVGGGIVSGKIDVKDGANLVIYAGTFDDNPSDYVAAGLVARADDPAVGPWTVGKPVTDVKPIDEKAVKVDEEAVSKLTEEQQEKVPAAVEELKQKIEESFKTDPVVAATQTHAAEIVKENQSKMVQAVFAAAVAQGKPLTEEEKQQVVENVAKFADGTADSDTTEYLKIETKTVAAKPVAVAADEVEAQADKLVYEVEPIFETVTVKTDAQGNVSIDKTIPTVMSNEDVEKNPVTFSLQVFNPKATQAMVLHHSEDPKYPDETFTCPIWEKEGWDEKVQALVTKRYITITTSHFSTFEITYSEAVYVASEATIGILKVERNAAGDIAVAAPFLKSGVAGEASAAVSELVVSGAATGDSAKAWTAGAATGNYEPKALTEEVAPGEAFWYSRAAADIPMALGGLVDTNGVTSVAAEPADKGMTLFTNPFRDEVNVLAKMTGAVAEGDQIVIEGSGTRYAYANSGWTKVVKGTSSGKATVRGENIDKPVTEIVVPAGKAFWYVSKGGKPTFKW